MAAVPAAPVVTAEQRTSRVPELLLVLLIVAVIGVGAYLLLPRLTPVGSAVATESPTPARTFRPTPTQRPVPQSTPVPEDTFGSTQTYGIGERITITNNGEPWANVTVSQVSQKAKYSGEYSDDVPAAGHTYIQAFVTYESLSDGVNYGSFDWQVFADGVAVDTYAITLNGPKPELGTGTLPKGRKAEGWLVYEVPKTGTIVMSYGGTFSGQAPVFEVVIRGS